MSKCTGLHEIFEQPYYPLDAHTDIQLSDAAFTVMDKKYLRGESPHEMFLRVATAVAKPLMNQMDTGDFEKIRFAFYNIMASRDFMPNSPTLMNAGRAFNQLAACFVVPVEDSMEGIFRDAIADMAMIQRTGGGTGFDFSRLRPKGALVSSTMGESSGPIPFMRAFNACTDTVKQGGARRGANMGILRVDHPDIREFIMLKSDPSEMTNFNLSVTVTDAFMKAVEANEKYDLVHNGKVYGQENAKEIWDLIGERAWAYGEPGVIFIDTINKKNTLRELGEIEATNPCGEQPLLAHEACNLGSINLKNMVVNGEVDYLRLGTVARLATCFLDCVIDAGNYPLEKITEKTRANRKIGLGVMGFADVCYMLEIGYDSPAASALAGKIMKTVQENAHVASKMLADLFGCFPNIEYSSLKGIRNATLTTIAPTGTISIIADASYGIEPFFALSYTKTLTDTGEQITFLNEHIDNYMNKHGFDDVLREGVEAYIFRYGTIKGVAEQLKEFSKLNYASLQEMEEIFVTAQDIAPVDHVHVQAAFQRFTDNAVSKTINFSNDTSIKDIQNVLMLSYKSGCKGVTVYRDGCRDSQPLKVTKTDTSVQVAPPKVHKRPTQLVGVTRQIPTGCGMMLVTVNMDEDGQVFEVLMRAGASGGCSAYTDAVARLLSIALRHNVPIEVLIDQLKSVRCDNFRYQSGKDPSLKGKSCPDVVGRFMEEIVSEGVVKPQREITLEELDGILKQASLNTTGAEGETCPSCGKLLLRAEGCLVCQCGYSRC